MQDRVICEGCGKKLQAGSTICLHCGWDQTTALAQPERPSVLEYLAKGGWRLVVYGVIFLMPVLGFMRLRSTGPGPDLATTLRWMAFGDGGRAAELETIHRIGSELGVNMVLGTSNISFGLPRRGLLNDSLVSMAISAGVTCHIADFSQIRPAVLASDLIMGRDPRARRYLGEFRLSK